MMVFGHLGLGLLAAQPWLRSRNLENLQSLKWVALGTLLPDLIDKPLYYGLSFWLERSSRDLGLISGTRTFGHMLWWPLLCGFMGGLGPKRLRSVFQALTLGILSHDVLDLLSSLLVRAFYAPTVEGPSLYSAFFFPLLGAEFPWMPYPNFQAQLGQVFLGPVFVGEVLGILALGALFIWEYNRRRGRKSKAGR
jgi:membrane-bound metal-dependent hydrolase YbcI (DUF457 family)